MTAVISTNQTDGIRSAKPESHDYGAGLKGSFSRAANEPFFSPDAPSMKERLGLEGDKPSLMATLSNQNYQPEAVSITSMMRSTAEVVRGGAQATANLDAGRADVADNKERFVKDFKEARELFCNAIRDVSQEKGLDPSNVFNSLGAIDNDLTKGQLILGVAAGAAMPASISAATLALGTLEQLKKDAGQISPKLQSEIVALALDRVRVAQAGPDPFVALEQENGKSPAPQPKFDFKKIDEKQALQLVMGDPKDQPEFKKLDALDTALDGVERNHKIVAKNPAVDASNLTDRGVSMVLDVASKNEEKLVEQPKPEDVEIAGMSLQGVQSMKFNTIVMQMPTLDDMRFKQALKEVPAYELAQAMRPTGLRA